MYRERRQADAVNNSSAARRNACMESVGLADASDIDPFSPDITIIQSYTFIMYTCLQARTAQASMTSTRQVFKGTAADLAAVIAPHAVRADWFEYAETASAKMSVPKLMKMRAMFRALHGLSDNFSFQATKVKSAMLEVWTQQRSVWPAKLADEHRDAWVTSMSARLRTALAHIARSLAKGRCRSTPPRWLQQLLADPARAGGEENAPEEEEEAEEEAEEEEEDEEEEEKKEEKEDRRDASEKGDRRDADEKKEDRRVADEKKKEDRRVADEKKKEDRRVADEKKEERRVADDEYFYGYCFERAQAWRAPASKPQNREYSKVYAPEGAVDTDFAVCQWDGKVHTVTDLAVKELKVRSACLWQASKGPVWTGALGDAALKLTKSIRYTDGNPSHESLAIFKVPSDGTAKEQLLQIIVHMFDGDIEAQRNKTVTLGVSLCEQLQAGTIPATRAALRAARDKVYSGEKRSADSKEHAEGKPPKKRKQEQKEQEQGATKAKQKERKQEKQEQEEQEQGALKKRPAAQARRPCRKMTPEEQEQEEEEEEEEEQEEPEESDVYKLARQELDDDLPPAQALDLGDLA